MRAWSGPTLLATGCLVGGLLGWSIGPAAAQSAAGDPPLVTRCHGLEVTILGTTGDDVLRGTRRRDVIVAGSGDDVVHGGRGDDVICGGKESDVLHGGRGADDLDGGLDRIVVAPEATYFYGDTIDGGPGDDRLDPGRDRYRDDGAHLGTFDTLDFAAGAAVHVDLVRGRVSGQGQDTIVTSEEMAGAGQRLRRRAPWHRRGRGPQRRTG